MYPIIRVDAHQHEMLEQLGTKRKFWFRADDGTYTLFKAEERGTGEDWAEKIACELCALLGLPHVRYDLATEIVSDVPGVVCATCAPPPAAMGLANQLLQELDPSYPGGSKYHSPAHTIAAAAAVLARLQPPPPPFGDVTPAGIASALDVFVGYIMLDAWIANQDRHHENWGALRTPSGLYLAPTYDHGASLARNVPEAEKKDRLESRDRGRQMPTFAKRARSAFYADTAQTRAMTTLEACQAFSQRAPAAARIWLERLQAVEPAMIDAILARIPPQRMSHISREFTRELLLENQRRLQAGMIS